MQRNPKAEQIVVRIPADLRKRLESMAARDSRTLSDLIRRLLERSARRAKSNGKAA